MSRYIKAFVRLIKVEDQIGNAIAFFTGYIFAGGLNIHGSLLPAFTATCFSLMAANALNQCTDADTDAINKPDRPIPSGMISLKEGYSIVAMLYAATLALGTLVSMEFFTLINIAVFLGIAYSIRPFRFKDRFIVSNLSIAIGYGALNFLLGWSVLMPLNAVPLHVLLFLTAFDFFANISKDYRDMEGDRIYGARTMPLVLGRGRSIAVQFSALYITFTMPVLFYTLACVNTNFVLVNVIGIMLVMQAHRDLLKNKDVECYKKMMLLYIAVRLMIVMSAILLF
ncbi:UbiA family prenyltransferase [Candidatus Nitrosocaldus islandicus]|uniref:UbiA family prenyltransferase n=1 Tax=Candidatus Nitrosocaldus islandicus TaxID=2045011 RepID=UPI000CD1A306|nr:UbiA family prenyltransferase [Candidatus Nitrosocaldus islandicus]